MLERKQDERSERKEGEVRKWKMKRRSEKTIRSRERKKRWRVVKTTIDILVEMVEALSTAKKKEERLKGRVRMQNHGLENV